MLWHAVAFGSCLSRSSQWPCQCPLGLQSAKGEKSERSTGTSWEVHSQVTRGECCLRLALAIGGTKEMVEVGLSFWLGQSVRMASMISESFRTELLVTRGRPKQDSNLACKYARQFRESRASRCDWHV